jgi:hypothetical protein
VFCEGLAEVSFVRDILDDFLGPVKVIPLNLRGGLTYDRVRREIRNHLAGAEKTHGVTTMIDLFGLPRDFPGMAQCDGILDPLGRVQALEERFAADLDDKRFVPYPQLHEFEALILVKVMSLARVYPNRKKALRELAKTVKSEFETPEHVDQNTPPSRHIRFAVPEYGKATDAILAIQEIGIDKIRGGCLHFHDWLTKLEAQAG